MSAITKDGDGPAFPWAPDGPNYQTHGGMSLRDYFAAKALAGHLASPSLPQASLALSKQEGVNALALTAQACYEYAPATQEARSK